MDALVQPALAVTQALLALGNEVMRTPLATLVRNRRAPKIWDANHVAHPISSTREEIDRLLVGVEEHYAGFPHRRFDLGATQPTALEARLERAGYVERRFEVMVLRTDLRGGRPAGDIRPIADTAGWSAFEALRAVAWVEEAGRLGLSADPDVADQTCLVFRAKSPPVRWWLACEDGEPQGYFSSWEGRDGIGQIEDLFVHPAHRHRGIATALVHHCVRDCRAHGAGPVLIVVDPHDTPRAMYAAMGFRSLVGKREYLRRG